MKYVYAENLKSGAKYYGKLSAVSLKKNKFCLTDMCVLTRDYQVKACHKHIEKRKRWFSFDSYRIFDKPVV